MDDLEAVLGCLCMTLGLGGAGLLAAGAIALARVGRRLDRLEQRLDALGPSPTARDAPGPIPIAPTPAPAPARVAAPGEPTPAALGANPEAAPTPVPAAPEPAPAAIDFRASSEEAARAQGPDPVPAPGEDAGVPLLTKVIAAGGGLAVASAAAFAVQLLYEQGFLSAEVRVAGGLLLGLALVVAGELVGGRSRPVAAALGGAGVVALYASVLAATRLYGFVGVTVGTLGLVAVTAAAIALSLRRGLLLALIGLLGGFATPAVLGADGGSPPLLFAYLFLLEVALLFTARGRGVGLVAALTAVGSWLWVLFALALPGSLGEPALVFASAQLFVLGTAAVFAIWALGGGTAASTARRWVGVPTIALAAVLAATLVARADHGPDAWGLFVALGVGTLVLAWRDARFALLPPVAATTTALLLAGFVLQGSTADPGWARDLAIALGVAVLWTVAPLALARGPSARRWAIFAATTAVVFTGLAVLAIFVWLEPTVSEVGARSLGAAYAVVVSSALVLAARRADDAGARRALTAGAATVGVWAVGTAAPGETWALTFSALLATYVWLAGRLPEPGLRRVAVGVATLAGLVLFVGSATAPDPLFGALPWAPCSWGAVAAALVYAAVQTRRDDDASATVTFFELGALGALAGFALVLVRSLFDPAGHPFAALDDVVELGVVLSAELALAVSARWSGARLPSPALRFAGAALGAVVLGGMAIGPLTFGLPIVTGSPVGGPPIANGLLAAYFLPAATLFGAALVAREEPDALRLGLRVAALLFVFAGVTLEVRHFYHAPDLATGDVLSAENAAYSLSWVALGLVLFFVALRGGSQLARFASFAVFVLTALKVSLVDTAALGGFQRIFAWLGLGVALLFVAYLDRLVPKPPRAPVAPPPGD